MANGTLRGAGAAVFGLIVLQTVTTQRGAAGVGGILGWVDSVLRRALSPDVAAIPDFANGKGNDNAVATAAQAAVTGAKGVIRIPTSTVPVGSHPGMT